MIVPLFSELWAGPPSGPVRRLAGGRSGCGVPRPSDVDVAGDLIVYSQRTQSCANSRSGVDTVILIDSRGKRVLARSTDATLVDVAIATPYVAWGRNTSAALGSAPSLSGSVIVYSLRTRAVAYRLPVRALGLGRLLAFDLQSDGSVAVVAEEPRGGSCGAGVVAWVSTSLRRPHPVAFREAGSSVRFADRTLVFVTPGPTCARAKLIAVDLRGRARTLAAFDPSSNQGGSLVGDFDFDGRRFTFAVTRALLEAKRNVRYETSLYLGRLAR